MTAGETGGLIKRLRTTRLLSQNLQVRMQCDAANEIEALCAIIDAIYAQGMQDHSTRCKPWWKDVAAMKARSND
jgi:hypothetical protein